MYSASTKIKPEERLLLEISAPLDETKTITEGLIQEVADWDNFIRMANIHGIVALAFHNLEKLDLLPYIPVESNNTLRTLYYKSLARNTFLAEKFIELKEILGEIEIETVVLKGMALEPSVYGNKGLRQMNDIDIYIPDKNECLRAWKHLIRMGYEPRPQKSALYNNLLLDYGKHLPDLNKDGISYDLHFSLFENEYPVKTLAVSTEKADLLIPDYDIHFLYLVKHLHDHELAGGSQLRLYLDLVQLFLMPGEKTSANHLVSLAKDLDIEDILIEKLFLLNVFWKVPVEGEILGKISPERKARATEAFIDFLRNPKGNTGRNKGAGYRKTLKNIPTMRKKLLFILGDIFPSIAFMQNRYGTKTRIGACVYYPLRFGKLLLLIRR